MSPLRAVSVALQVAGFRPDSGSNQVRIPVAEGSDPVDVALRALDALGATDRKPTSVLPA